jgi:hypothetical protein
MIARIYEADPLLCPCGGTFRIVGFVTEWETIAKILERLRSPEAQDETGGSPGADRPPPARPGPAPGLPPA